MAVNEAHACPTCGMELLSEKMSATKFCSCVNVQQDLETDMHV